MPYPHGETHHCSKYSNSLVRKVRNEYMPWVRGRGYEALSKKYGVPYETVRDWCQGVTRCRDE